MNGNKTCFLPELHLEMIHFVLVLQKALLQVLLRMFLHLKGTCPQGWWPVHQMSDWLGKIEKNVHVSVEAVSDTSEIYME